MTRSPAGIRLALVFALAFTLFASTASRTITWWDGAHYPVVAATLSITNPPGSLLLTVLGWLWTRVLWCPPFAFQLNLLAAAIAAATVTVVAACAPRMFAAEPRTPARDAAVALVTGAWLATAFHLWTYATQYTPYGLSALFTAMILGLFLGWWHRAEDADDLQGLALLALVIGLDFSAHRTNQLLAPALLLGVALRRPRVLLSPRALAAALLAYAAGLATQAGYLALSARHPPIDMLDGHSLGDLWRFVRLDPIGGGFLLNLWPRRADFVRVQLADWGHFLWTNLGAAPVTRWAGLLVALLGLTALWRRSRRLAIALLTLFACAGLGAVLYFNRPATYFRTFDRHYLASLVVLSLFVGSGLHALAVMVRPPRPAAQRVVTALLGAAVVGWNLAANHAACDRSHTRYAEEFGRDLLEPLAPHAILFTNGDNDSFPPYYLQWVEHVRPDVLIVNLPILWMPGRQRQLQRAESAFANVRFGEHPAGDLVEANRWQRPVYLAVTVAPESAPELQHDLVVEGLVSRMRPPGSPPPDETALERFFAERALRALTGHERELLEPEIGRMLGSYVFAGIRLAQLQAARQDTVRALATLAQLERATAAPVLGEWTSEARDSLVTFRRGLEEWASERGPHRMSGP
jgi:hypothetical protein